MSKFEEDMIQDMVKTVIDLDLPARLIGNTYRFECKFSDHRHIIIGTVTDITISIETGLMLRVSNREFLSQKLIGFYWNPDDMRWFATLHNGEPCYNFYQGTIHITD